eukprot:6174439-Pleurochrysis_carterae.AAC.1
MSVMTRCSCGASLSSSSGASSAASSILTVTAVPCSTYAPWKYSMPSTSGSGLARGRSHGSTFKQSVWRRDAWHGMPPGA